MTGPRIDLEPARFGRTGVNSYLEARADCPLDLVQPLDAPQCIARGSVQAGHITHDGAVYASTTDLIWDRVRL